MLDYRLLRSDPQTVLAGMAKRNETPELVDKWLELDKKWREAVTQTERLTAEQNAASKAVAEMKRAGQEASAEIARLKGVSDQIAQLRADANRIEEEREATLLLIPNIPHESVPPGKESADNPEHKRWGEKAHFDFQPKPHWEIAEALGIIDFEAGAKIGGSGFIVYKGLGARLERALISFMIDLHVSKHGYTEVFPPFLVRPEVLQGTGQLPKFREDMYHCADDDLYLIPTAEVPVTNIHRDEILEADQLPINYAAYSPCFRREAGAAGRLTRGLLRVHQFNKVELVKFALPEESYAEHEKLLADAESVLQALGLHYRVVTLCGGDLGFAAAKCYDLEVWSPGVGEYLEVSSCSNFEAFQARRANIRFRREGGKPEFVHTLNASGTALPRLVAALIETYQGADGSIKLPEPLYPYMGKIDRIA